MAKKVTLKDKDDVVLYPQTVADAVFDANGESIGETVNTNFPVLINFAFPSEASSGKRIKSDLTWEVASDKYKYLELYLAAGYYRIICTALGSGCLPFVQFSDDTYVTATRAVVGNGQTDTYVNLETGYYVLSWDSDYGVNPKVVSYNNVDSAPTASSKNFVFSGGVKAGMDLLQSNIEEQIALVSKSSVTNNAAINSLIEELYLPNYAASDTYSLVINAGKKIENRYYNSLYIYINGTLTIIFDENFATEQEALSNFVGIKGGSNGYALVIAPESGKQISTSEFVFNHPLTDQYAPSIAFSLYNQAHNLSGKKILWEGDSICADNEWNNTGWRTRVQAITGAAGVNYSEGGSVITANVTYPGSSSVVPSVYTRLASDIQTTTDADFFIFDGGTNDADRIGRIVDWANNDHTAIKEVSSKPAAFGSWNITDFSGNYDTDTFCGAFEQIIFDILSSYKGKKIGYIVAPKMGNQTSLTFYNRKAYFDTAKEICKKWGVPYIDLWETSWMNPNLASQYDSSKTKAQNVAAGNYYLDGQHPAPDGFDYLSGLIADWVSKL